MQHPRSGGLRCLVEPPLAARQSIVVGIVFQLLLDVDAVAFESPFVPGELCAMCICLISQGGLFSMSMDGPCQAAVGACRRVETLPQWYGSCVPLITHADLPTILAEGLYALTNKPLAGLPRQPLPCISALLD